MHNSYIHLKVVYVRKMEIFNITKFTSVLPAIWPRPQSIDRLVHSGQFCPKNWAIRREEAKKFGVVFFNVYILLVCYLTCSAINRCSSNHCVGRPFQKQHWCIQKIFSSNHAINLKENRKITMQKNYFKINCMDQT